MSGWPFDSLHASDTSSPSCSAKIDCAARLEAGAFETPADKLPPEVIESDIEAPFVVVVQPVPGLVGVDDCK